MSERTFKQTEKAEKSIADSGRIRNHRGFAAGRNGGLFNLTHKPTELLRKTRAVDSKHDLAVNIRTAHI